MSDPVAIRQHYASLTERELLQIALHEVADLAPAGVSALRAELKSRGLEERLGDAVDAQAQELDPAAVAQLADRIRQIPCLLCGSNGTFTNGFEVGKARSFLFYTTLERSLLIACPACTSRAARRATLTTLLWGWWAIPWGPIRTVQALLMNLRALRTEYVAHPTVALLRYVEAHPGEVVMLLRADSEEERRF